jgi:hypothetical protein
MPCHGDRTSGKVGIEALLQVTVHKVEYKVQLGRLRDDLR